MCEPGDGIKGLYTLFKKSIKFVTMKSITLTLKEFYMFKEIADFWYDVVIRKNSVRIKADINHLSKLGYL